jgi:hypothetical protein
MKSLDITYKQLVAACHMAGLWPHQTQNISSSLSIALTFGPFTVNDFRLIVEMLPNVMRPVAENRNISIGQLRNQVIQNPKMLNQLVGEIRGQLP